MSKALKIKYKTDTKSIELKALDIILKKLKSMQAEKNELDKKIKEIQKVLQHLEQKKFSTSSFDVHIKRKKRESILSKAEMVEKLGAGYKEFAKTKMIWDYDIKPVTKLKGVK